MTSIAWRALVSASALWLAAGTAHAVVWTVQVRDGAGRPLAGTVIAIQVNGQSAKAPTSTTAEMAQRARQFQPHVLVVQTGTAVNFPNFDTVRHHVYSFSTTKTFDIKLYAGTPASPVVFDSPGIATLGCNIHDRMSAHIVVVDTPLFAQSDEAGLVKLDLPPGDHLMVLWHPKSGAAAPKSRPISVGKDGGQMDLTLVIGD